MTKLGKKVPFGAIMLGSVGVAALVRAFWRPFRSVVRDGFVLNCEGTDKQCSNYLKLQSYEGAVPVYSMGTGNVIDATGDAVFVVPNNEAVVLEYKLTGTHQMMVRPGEKVSIGQQVAAATIVEFGVYEIRKDSKGLQFRPVSPSAWLAARGMTISATKHPSSANTALWCDGGRKLTVPQQVGLCNIRLPDPSAISLLPVSVRME